MAFSPARPASLGRGRRRQAAIMRFVMAASVPSSKKAQVSFEDKSLKSLLFS
jgi:hypothetical protein